MGNFNREAAKAAGYTDSEIDSFLAKSGTQKPTAPAAPVDDPAEGMTLNVAGFDTGIGLHPSVARGLAGAGKAFMDAGRGLGLVDSADAGTKAAESKLMDTTAGKVGKVVGDLAITAPTMLIPGVNTVKGAAAVSGLTNAALTEGDAKQRMEEGFKGALAGGAGTMAIKGLSRVISPNVSPEIAGMMDEGVRLTPGQMLGGTAKRAEEAMESIPVIGDAIKRTQKQALEDYNNRVLNRVLKPLQDAGLSANPTQAIGNAGVADIHRQLSSNYDALLPKLQANALEPEFVNKMASLRIMVQNLPKEEAQYFDNILSREIDHRLAPNGMISGDNLGAVNGALRQAADRFANSNSGYQQELGQALKQANREFRDLIERSNPSNASELQAIRHGYAQFKRVQRATADLGAQDGVFTPGQLRSAVRALDKSKDKGAFAEGRALMQDVADMGKDTLSPNIPQSGAPLRAAAMTLMGAGIINPKLPLAMLAGAGMYSEPVRRTLQAAMSPSGPTAVKLSDLLRANAGIPGVAAGALTLE